MAWESLFFGSMPLKSAGPTFPPPAYPVDDLPRVENLLAVAKLNAVAAGALDPQPAPVTGLLGKFGQGLRLGEFSAVGTHRFAPFASSARLIGGGRACRCPPGLALFGAQMPSIDAAAQA